MSLTLIWRSFRGTAPPYPLSITLDERGGTLGRATENQFIVYDPQRFASRHHATISAYNGDYYIEDASSSGTLINNDTELFQGQHHQLQHSDTLTIGECDIEVCIMEQHTLASQDPMSSAAMQQSVSSSPQSSDSFDINDFFPDEPSPPSPGEALVHASNPLMLMTDMMAAPSENTNIDAIAEAFDFDSPHQADQAKMSPNQQSTTASASINHQVTDTPLQTEQDTLALRAFLKELDIDPQEFIGQNKVNVMQVAGVILRTLTQGMMDVLQARAAVKKHFNMDNTQIKSACNNPLKFSLDSTQAMTRMLKQEEGFMDPIESAKEAVNDAKAHQMAMVSGLDAAIKSTIESFDPGKLEPEFAKENNFTFSKKAKYWQCYHHKYQQISDEAESTSNTQFSLQFNQQYEQQIRTFYEDEFK